MTKTTMEPDDFERRLQRQPLRQVPAEWRAEILGVAADVCQRQTPTSSRGPASVVTMTSWLRELLWPSPVAWAGLAVVWIVILGLHWAASFEPTVSSVAAGPPRRSIVFALLEHRRQVNELLDGSATEPTAPPRPAPAGPRSAVSVTNSLA